ncbi:MULTISPECIES: M15 family metallopeptidase [Pseudoalteromonas]|uniref:M15 family metallopeptidase n=1 Tax=Pseudoalteromonas TaxID=53246 RepID=UPI000BBC337A|nr:MULTISPECIES: M15 family metallopeptidase [Pseudoalteromonas]MCK8095273.1 M15 family metallopeptidase [Pseudoalteromonas sp. 1CM17D]
MNNNAVVSALSGVTDLFGGFSLQRGDNDKKQIWEGKSLIANHSFVSELQILLNKLGTYKSKVDGDFGLKTALALKLFQWNAKSAPYRLKNLRVINQLPTFKGSTSGQTDKATRRELNIWAASNFQCTGDLLRLREATFTNIELNPNFKLIANQNVLKGEFVVSATLITEIKAMNIEAKKLGLKLVLNQTVRQLGVSPNGAVVTPAKRSQHYIGHALDLNIVDGSNWNNSTAFKTKSATSSAIKFIDAMKKRGLRWGGDFTRMDSPHFDKQLSASTFDYEAKHFFNQSSISNNQMIPLSI